MGTTYDFHILEWWGGECEDAFDGSAVYISREKAEAEYKRMVEEARADEHYTHVDYIGVCTAHLDEETGVIVRDTCKPVMSWFRYEEEEDDE